MIYQYIRYSTERQDEESQKNMIQNYCNRNHIIIDKTISDDGISGTVSYTERNLIKLFDLLKTEDTLIVSEVSRITRGGLLELSEILKKYLVKYEVTLIICEVDFTIKNCAKMDSFAELQLMFMAMGAKDERKRLSNRTKYALNAIKEEIEEKGFHIGKKSGNTITKLGGNNIFSDKALQASAESRKNKALSNANNLAFWEFIQDYQLIHGALTSNSSFSPVSDELNKRKKLTSTGLPYNSLRARAMYQKCKELYRK